MILQLRYQSKPQFPLAAAYVTGSTRDWFAEISGWRIDPLTVRCYLVPESLSSNICKGLLVIFDEEIPDLKLIRFPYARASTDFFIPLHATLFPSLLPDELATIKLWPIQMFHPHIGIIGFEENNVNSLADLIETPIFAPSQWLTDFPSPPVLPQLLSIQLETIEEIDAIEALKENIGQLDLQDIPKTENEGSKFFNRFRKILLPLAIVALWILGFIVFIMKIIAYLFPKRRFDGKPQNREGLMERLQKWINQKRDSIEKQRDTELNRLVNLFDKDKDLALQYAIPLNSPYLERGTAVRTGRLSRTSLNFNFGNFGGGYAADGWDLGNYRWVLQQQYEKSARQAIEEGDYKKAAYIYAHLLGDFNRAAQTLKDGKHYREAAAIYKDHLKNQSLAAECLENGGLLTEALPLYIALGNYEKAGDLHVQLGQQAKANKYYEDVIAKSLTSRDYLNASRLLTDKLNDSVRSQDVLLIGWKENAQAETCLKKYFQSISLHEGELNNAVKEVYQNHVSGRKGTSFLNVLAEIKGTQNNEDLNAEALQICYEIINTQAQKGDFSGMNLIGRFIANDSFIVNDAHRYSIRNHQSVQQLEPNSQIQLEKEMQFLDFCSYHDQLLGIALKHNRILLLRMNWNNDMEYQYLYYTTSTPNILLTADTGNSTDLFLTGDSFLTNKSHGRIPDGSFERGFELHEINWENENMYCLSPGIEPKTLYAIVGVEDISLIEYDLTGKCLSSVVCLYKDEIIKTTDIGLHKSRMYWRKNHFYFTGTGTLIRTTKDGMFDILGIEAEVIDFSISNVHAALKVAVLTAQGCLIVTPNLKEMEITTPFFEEELNAHLLQLLSDNLLVLAAEKEAKVFDISNKNPRLLFEVSSDHEIVRIFVIPKRRHFGLLSSDNKISIHEIPAGGL